MRSDSRRRILRLANRLFGGYLISIIAWWNRFRPNIVDGNRCNYQRVLIIKVVGLGDTVLMLPALKKLKDQLPNARITALLTRGSAGVLSQTELVDEALIFDILGKEFGLAGFCNLIREIRARKFDLVIDFEQHLKLVTLISYLSGANRRIGFDNGVIRRGALFTDSVQLDGSEHMATSFCSLLVPLGVQFVPSELVPVTYSRQASSLIRDWRGRNGIRDNDICIGIHVGSGPSAIARRWPIERFARIAEKLYSQYGAKIILTGSLAEIELVRELADLARCPTIPVAGVFEFDGFVALLASLNAFLCNDTGPLHIAASLGVSTVGIFGPNTPARYGPFGGRHTTVFAGLECSPCIQVHQGLVPECSNPVYMQCMTDIGVDSVWRALVEVLNPLTDAPGDVG